MRRPFHLAIAIAIGTLAPASEKTDVMQVVQRWADAFGRRSFDTSNAPCADDAVVIDDFPPHVWQGAGACSRWFKAFEAWAATNGATDAVIEMAKPGHFESTAGFAYLVAPVTLSYGKAGKRVDFPGTLTMSLRKSASGWLVSGVAWTDR